MLMNVIQDVIPETIRETPTSEEPTPTRSSELEITERQLRDALSLLENERERASQFESVKRRAEEAAKSLQSELEDRNNELQTALDAHSRTLTRVEQLEKENESIQQKLDDALARCEAEQATVRDLRETLERRVSELEQQNEELEQKLADALGQLGKSKDEAEVGNDDTLKISNLQKLNDDLNARVEEIQSFLDAEKAKSAQLEEEVIALKQQEESSPAPPVSTAAHDALEQEILRLSQELSDALQASQEQSSLFTNLQRENEGLRLQLSEAHAATTQTQKYIISAVEEVQAKLADAERELSSIRAECDEKDERIGVLGRENTQLRQSVGGLNGSVHDHHDHQQQSLDVFGQPSPNGWDLDVGLSSPTHSPEPPVSPLVEEVEQLRRELALTRTILDAERASKEELQQERDQIVAWGDSLQAKLDGLRSQLTNIAVQHRGGRQKSPQGKKTKPITIKSPSVSSLSPRTPTSAGHDDVEEVQHLAVESYNELDEKQQTHDDGVQTEEFEEEQGIDVEENLRMQLHLTTTELHALSLERDALSAQVSKLVDKLEHLAREHDLTVENMQSWIRSSQSKVSGLAGERAELAEKCRVLEGENAKLKEMLESVKVTKSEETDTKVDHQQPTSPMVEGEGTEKVQQESDQPQKDEEAAQDKEEDRDNLVQRIENLEAERQLLVETHNKRIQFLESQLQGIRAESDAAISERDTLAAQLAVLQGDLNSALGNAAKALETAAGEQESMEELSPSQRELPKVTTAEELVVVEREREAQEVSGSEVEQGRTDESQQELLAQAAADIAALEELRARLDSLSTEKSAMDETHRSLVDQLQQLLEDSRALSAARQELEARVSELLAENASLATQHTEAITRIDSLFAILEETRRVFAVVSSETQQVAAVIDGQLHATTAQRDDLAAKLGHLALEHGNLRKHAAASVQALQMQFEEAKTRVSELEGALHDAQERYTGLETQLQEVKGAAAKETQAAKEARDRSVEETAMLVDSLRDLTEQNKNLKKEIKDLEAANEGKVEEAVAACAAEAEQRFTVQVEELRAVIAGKEQEIASLQAELARAGEEEGDRVRDLEARIAEVTRERDEAVAQVSQLAAQIEQVEQARQAEEAAAREAQEAARAAQEDNHRLSSEISSLTLQMDTMRQEKSKLEADFADAVRRCMESDDEVGTYRQQTDALQTQIMELEREVGASVARAVKADERAGEFEREVAQVMERIRVIEEEAEAQRQELVMRMEQEKARDIELMEEQVRRAVQETQQEAEGNVARALESAREEAEARLAEMRLHVSQLESALENQQMGQSELGQQVTELSSKLAQTNEEATALRALLENKENELREAAQELSEATRLTEEAVRQNELARARVQELESVTQSLEVEVMSLRPLRDQLQSVHNARTDLEQQLSELRNQLEVLDLENESLQQQSLEAKESIRVLEERLAQAENDKTGIEADAIMVAEENEGMRATVAGLKEENQGLHHLVESLGAEKMELEARAKALAEQVDASRAAVVGQVAEANAAAAAERDALKMKLEKDMEAMRAQIGEFQEKKGAIETERDLFHAQVVDLVRVRDTLAQEKDVLVHRVAELEGVVKGLEEEREGLQNAVQEIDARLVEVVGEKEGREKEVVEVVSGLEALVNGLQEEKSKLAVERDELMHSIEGFHAHLEEVNNKRVELTDQVGKLNHTVEELQQQLQVSELQLIEMQEKFNKQIDEDRKAFEEEKAAVVAERDAASTRVSELEGQLTRVVDAQRKAEESFQSMQATFESQVAEYENLLYATKDTAEKDRFDQMRLIDQLSSNLDQLRRAAQETEQQLRSEIEVLVAKLEESEKFVAEVTSKQQEQDQEYQQIHQQLQSVLAEKSELLAKLNDVNQHVSFGEKEQSAAHERVSALTAEVDRLQAEHAGAVAALKAAEDKVSGLEKEAAALRSELDEAIQLLAEKEENGSPIAGSERRKRDSAVQQQALEKKFAEVAVLADYVEKIQKELSTSANVMKSATLKMSELRIDLERYELAAKMGQLVDLSAAAEGVDAKEVADTFSKATAELQAIAEELGKASERSMELDAEVKSPSTASSNPILTPAEDDPSVLRKQIEYLNAELALKIAEVSRVSREIQDAQAKIDNYRKMSENAVTNMEVFRDELLKKGQKLDAAEDQLLRIRSDFSLPSHVSVNTTPEGSIDVRLKNAVEKAGATIETLDNFVRMVADEKKAEGGQENWLNAGNVGQVFGGMSGGQKVAPFSDGEAPGGDDETPRGRSRIAAGGRRSFRSPSRASASRPPPVDVGSLVSHFVSTVGEYQGMVADLVEKRNLVLRMMEANPGKASTKLSEDLHELSDRLQDVETQHEALMKQTQYLRALVRRTMHDDETDYGDESEYADSEYQSTARSRSRSMSRSRRSSVSGFSDDDASVVDGNSDVREYRLGPVEYHELTTKAAQVDQYAMQFENAQGLLKDHAREIQVLKEAIETITNVAQQEGVSVAAEQSANGNSSDAVAVRLLQRQVEELRKVWSHQLSANIVLRNLIAKTQTEAVHAEQESRRQQVRLKEEFDELVALFESTNKDMSHLRTLVAERDRELRELKMRYEDKINAQFFEQAEQAAMVDEMHGKEREALNKYVVSLERERDRLVADFARAKAKIEQALKEEFDEERKAWQSQKEKLEEEVRALAKRAHEAVEDARASVAAEQRRAREQSMAKVSEMRANYEKMLEEVRAQKRSAEERLGAAENGWFDEKEALLRRVTEAEERATQASEERQNLRQQLQNKERSIKEEKRELESRLERRDRSAAEERRELERRLVEKDEEIVAERREFDRKIAERESTWHVERRLLTEELARLREEPSIMGSDRDSAVRFIRNQKETLEKILTQKDMRIKHLETRVMESEDSLRRLAELEKDIMSGNAQVRDLQYQLGQSEEARRIAETQAKYEKDRSKRFARQIEDLKKQLLDYQLLNGQVKDVLETNGPLDERLREELNMLKQVTIDVVRIMQPTFKAILGKSTFETLIPESNKLRLDLGRLQEQCSLMIQEVLYERALLHRFALQRADLQFQKMYLGLKVNDLLESQKVTLTFIKGMGVSTPAPSEELSPKRKFIRCVNIVISLFRMRILSRNWHRALESFGRDKLDEKEFLDPDYSKALMSPSASVLSAAHEKQISDLNAELTQLRMAKSQLEQKRMTETLEKRAIELENERLKTLLK
ncbi:hypothetical protein HK102_000002 [Quaeritorhiza haematococci]|nr:hypothetical protein HK102_000002 [Quaeritorhiza haematococci]